MRSGLETAELDPTFETYLAYGEFLMQSRGYRPKALRKYVEKHGWDRITT